MDLEVRYGAIAGSLPQWCQEGEAIDNQLKCQKLREYSIKPVGPGRISKVGLRRRWKHNSLVYQQCLISEIW